jgi:hypothetical protein
MTLSGAPAVLKTTVAAFGQPPFPFQSEKSDQTPALNLHSVTPPPMRTPRSFLPQGFSDACLRAYPRTCAGRHPKTPNDSGRSRDRDQTAQFIGLRMSLKPIDL